MINKLIKILKNDLQLNKKKVSKVHKNIWHSKFMPIFENQ